jgi:hypothetical protein
MAHDQVLHQVFECGIGVSALLSESLVDVGRQEYLKHLKVGHFGLTVFEI